MDEANLIRRAKAGDRNAAGELCALHWRTVYALAFARLGNAAEAEDVTQEAFSRLWAAFARFEGDALGPYLRTIAANLARNRLRDAGRHPAEPLPETPPEDPGPTIEQQVVQQETRRELLSALFRLTDEHREVLTLRLLDGRSVAEVAQMLRRTPQAVRALQYRALQRLRSLLDVANDLEEV